ncbi:hypothetical protein TSOC_012933 [Tetrabaena socialis]|uniref:Uncharacterized protein n=1 Tax=Tetrabaena socialis TaxID=47790 RepID=A0A2J7ZLQ4_9CHLO|nr:hypothetical protein TSOC_012933 [Tetrabaena socialis]|eukprot:PNH01196.1 hypothetical protein TSOC_012933 [Tetrabaena socialis]
MAAVASLTKRGCFPAQRRFPARGPASRRPIVMVRARSADDLSEGHSDYHLTADTIAFNAKHASALSRRIAQVRAAEVVQDALPSRPELPSSNETEAQVAQRLAKWHEDQWKKLRACQPGQFDDDGIFGGA